jgi:hypothetical protein
MKHRKSNSQKTKRLRPADFPPPKRVSQEKVSEICQGLEISDRRAAELKEYLDYLVDYVHESMSQKVAADRQGDREGGFGRPFFNPSPGVLRVLSSAG